MEKYNHDLPTWKEVWKDFRDWLCKIGFHKHKKSGEYETDLHPWVVEISAGLGNYNTKKKATVYTCVNCNHKREESIHF